MPHNDMQEQLDKYLADAHSIEEQALIQMRPRAAHRRQPAAGAPRSETTSPRPSATSGSTRERMEARGASPSRFKDLVMKAGAPASRCSPEVPARHARQARAHAYSYEHLEVAPTSCCCASPSAPGRYRTAEIARTIRDEERAMAERLAGSFDVAVTASLDAVKRDDLDRRSAPTWPTPRDREPGDRPARTRARGSRRRAHDSLYAEHLDETMRQHAS
jgi:ferritin-like metal-binding protein YciE